MFCFTNLILINRFFVEPLSSSTTAANQFETRERFVQHEVPNDERSLFTSICYPVQEIEQINAQKLRKETSDQILKMKPIIEQDFRLFNRTTFDKYLNDIGNIEWSGGALDFELISYYIRTSIRIVTMGKTDNIVSSIVITEFPIVGVPFAKCIYLMNIEEDHYEPLYLECANAPNGMKKIVDRNDETVPDLLGQFFKEKYDCKII